MDGITKLTSDMDGRYLVTTQGSEHIWDLDNLTYERIHKSGDNAMFYDGEVIEIGQVIVWPEVGKSFYFVFDHHTCEWHEERYHISSTVKSIRLLEEEEWKTLSTSAT